MQLAAAATLHGGEGGNGRNPTRMSEAHITAVREVSVRAIDAVLPDFGALRPLQFAPQRERIKIINQSLGPHVQKDPVMAKRYERIRQLLALPPLR